jgi:acyl carrier protein
MEQSDIYKSLEEIFQEVFDDDGISLTPETSAEDIPEWDSFNHVNIVVASEMRFGVRFRASELEELNNVGDFVKLVQEKLSA